MEDKGSSQTTGTTAGSSDDTPSWVAQYASPEAELAGSLMQQQQQQPASLWDAQNREMRKRKLPLPATELIEKHPEVQLCPSQREVLEQVVSSLDVSTSVVITNPLMRDNPIVYVTKSWENMCGFTYEQAIGRNPRLTQGAHSDPAVVRSISGALRQQRGCKVMMLNYRSGLPNQPFWNMLSISPIVHKSQLQFYLANLQDYTYHMGKLMRLAPSQFCRSAEHHQETRRLPSSALLEARDLARPGIIETDDACAIVAAPRHSDPLASAVALKRLGWSKLTLEPEHLTDRVEDALQSLDARYERIESAAHDDDVFVVNADIDGVACRVLVTRDPTCDGAYRISCTRLGGDTFRYHDALRQLREQLGDAVHNGAPLREGTRAPTTMAAQAIVRGQAIEAVRGRRGAFGGLAPMPMGLAPMPDVSDVTEVVEATGGGGGGSGASTAGDMSQ